MLKALGGKDIKVGVHSRKINYTVLANFILRIQELGPSCGRDKLSVQRAQHDIDIVCRVRDPSQGPQGSDNWPPGKTFRTEQG